MKNKTLSLAAAAIAVVATTAIVAGAAYADNSSKFAEMRQAMQSGDFDQANSLHAELGLPDMRQMHGRGEKMGWGIMGGLGGLTKDADVKAAVDADDYGAFKTAIEAHSPLRYITSDNFAEYADAYKAGANKDFSKMKTFMEKYGPTQATQK